MKGKAVGPGISEEEGTGDVPFVFGLRGDDFIRVDGMRGVGTPILNRETGQLLGALTVAGPTRRLNGERFREELPDLLQRASKMVEVNITYS